MNNNYFMEAPTLRPNTVLLPSFSNYDRSNHLQQPDVVPYQQKELERFCEVQRQAAFQQQLAIQRMVIQKDHYEQYQLKLAHIHNQAVSISSNNSNHTHKITKKNDQIGKAKRRAEHNAIERARRESLNSKFQLLAHSLPNLQDDHRPSKNTIIERTLEFVKKTVEKEETFQQEIDKLRESNRTLFLQMAESDSDNDAELFYEEEEEEEEDGFSSSSGSHLSVRSELSYSSSPPPLPQQQETLTSHSPSTDDSSVGSPDPSLFGNYQFLNYFKQDNSNNGLNLSAFQDNACMTPYTTHVMFNENQFYY